MTKLLERAMAEASALPDTMQDQIGSELLGPCCPHSSARLLDTMQDQIGSELLAHIEKLRRLRGDLDAGLRSLDAGAGRELDIEAVIRRARGADADS